MSSTGQIVGYVVGAVVGYFTGPTGGMMAYAAVGGAIGSMLDPPKGPKLTGPRLTDLNQQLSAYGVTIPRVYGSVALTGNIFWIENNALKESSHTSGGGKGGGGGAETTTYSYSATFAIGLCEGPIIGVRRIWAMGNLIYDAGSNDIDTMIVSNKAVGGFRIHLGDDTQLPDARMQASLGIGACPAYRGLAYIVFDDFELEKYGNTLMGAQIKVEVMTAAADSTVTLLQSRTLTQNLGSVYKASALNCSADAVMHAYLSTAHLWSAGPGWALDLSASGNVEAKIWGYQEINWGNANGYVQGWSDKNECLSIDTVGNLWTISSNSGGTTAVTLAGTSALAGSVGWQNFTYHRRNGRKILCIESNPTNETFIVEIGLAIDITLLVSRPSDALGRLSDIFLGENYNYGVTSANKVVCYDQDFGVLWSIDLSGLISVTNNIGGEDAVIREKMDQVVVLRYGNKFYEIDADGYTHLGTLTGVTLDSYESHGGDHLVYPMWLRYDAWTNKTFTVRLDGLSNTTMPLSAIVSAECLKSKVLTSGDIDTTSLTDQVRGYRVTSVSALRAAIEPLQNAWPFDVVQHGYGIKFVRRGSLGSVAVIDASSLGAHSGKDDSTVVLTTEREMDTQLPCRVSVTHLDFDREYDPGEQYAERLNTNSVNVLTVEMPIVLKPDEAVQMAEVLLYLYWTERNTVRFTLPESFNQLEPADIITLITNGKTLTLRITEISYRADGVLELAASYNNNTGYSSSLIGGTAAVLAAPVSVGGPSLLMPLDIPLLQDAYNLPGYPVAMAGYLPGWKGGLLFRSDDTGQSWQVINAFSTSSRLGIVPTAIGAPADSRLIDTASVLTVSLYAGSLSSVTESQMLNGANHFAYGIDGRWEIIAAENCVLQGDGTYKLSNFLRGRFGTEWACETHAANDFLVQLSNAYLQFSASSLNQIGYAKLFRAVTMGSALDSASDFSFTYKGVNLECLSPTWLNGDRHPTTSDWALSWVRRTRTGGEWRDKVDATLGESSEAYEVEIYSSGTYATLKRTITGLSSAASAYTSAQQVADFGSNQATLYVKIYQLSASMGRGYPLTTSITR